MIRKNSKSTNGESKHIKKECTIVDIMYKMYTFEERGGRGVTSSPQGRH